MVIAQEPAEPFSTLNRPFASGRFGDRGKQQDIASALMIALRVIMRKIGLQRSSQRALTEQNKPGQALLLDRFHPSLGMGVQVRTAGREGEGFDLTGLDNRSEGTGVLCVPLIEQL